MSRLASTCLDKTPLDTPKKQTLLEGTIPHLEFLVEITSNNLTYEGTDTVSTISIGTCELYGQAGKVI